MTVISAKGIYRSRTYQVIERINGGPRWSLIAEFVYLEHAYAYALEHGGAWTNVRDSSTHWAVANVRAFNLAQVLYALEYGCHAPS